MDELRTEISLPTTKPTQRRRARTSGCEDCRAKTREMRDRIEDVEEWAADLEEVAGNDVPEELLRGIVTAMAFAIQMKANEVNSELNLQTCERCYRPSRPAFKTYAELHPDPSGGGSISVSDNPQPFAPGI